MDIQGKIAIITGASEGIGLATAQLLSLHGAKVVLAARTTEVIEAQAKDLPGSLAVTTDMRKQEDIENLFQKTLETYGRVDILVNNAGQGLYGPVDEIPLEAYRSVMELNVVAVLAAMQQAVPIMRKQGGGVIVNVSSRLSKQYIPGTGAYTSMKYALNALSLIARQELEKDNIVVSLILPKMVATRFGINAFNPRKDDRVTGQRAPGIDTAGDVAEKLIKLIESGEAEVSL